MSIKLPAGAKYEAPLGWLGWLDLLRIARCRALAVAYPTRGWNSFRVCDLTTAYVKYEGSRKIRLEVRWLNY